MSATTDHQATAATAGPKDIKLYSHSAIFYWWPVWLVGYVCCLISYFGDYHLAVVPAGSLAVPGQRIELADADANRTEEVRDVIVLPKGAAHLTTRDPDGNVEIAQPTLYVSRFRGVGTVFVIVLLFVAAITNLSVRGLWTVFVVLSLLMLTIIFQLAGWWGSIFRGVSQLSIFINMGGYFLISTVLFVLWLVNVFVFDKQTYMIFTPGQLRVRLEIGGGETVYDTSGMVVQKQRTDIFRHWVLGLGSGDLIVRPVGLGHALELPNVLHVGHAVKRIEELVKERMIVRGPDAHA